MKEVIEKKLEVKDVNSIYIQLTENNEPLSEKCKNVIVYFFTKNKINARLNNLVELIEKCKKFRNTIFSNLDNYIIKEEDFFSLEATDNYLFYKKLVKKNLLHNIQFQKINYISKTMKVVMPLQAKLDQCEINYKTLIAFFNNEQSIKLLKSRIKYIFMKGRDTLINDIYNKIESKVKGIKEDIDNLEKILRYLLDFCDGSPKEEIINILNRIESLKNDYIGKNKKNEYSKYISKYLDKAKKYELKKKSIIYNEIYKETKNKYKKKEKYLAEAKKIIRKLKTIFKNYKRIKKIDETLIIYLKPLISKNEDEIKEELNLLMRIFNFKEKKINNSDFNEIQKDLLLILKRDHIYNIASAITFFIKLTGAKTTDFYNDINSIIGLLKKNNDINTIGDCKRTLKEREIDLNEKDNEYIDILLCLNEHKNEAEFLFKTTIQECDNLLELSLQSDNVYVTVKDILNMKKCKEFSIVVGNEKMAKELGDKKTLKILKDYSKVDKTILINLRDFFLNYNNIKMLNSSLNKSESFKNQIHTMISNSYFILSSIKEDSFKCYSDENIFDLKLKNEPILSKENIISLRERAQLSKITSPEYNYFIEKLTETLNI